MTASESVGSFKKLAENPRPRGVRKLAGLQNLYRIRQGQYRVIYQILDDLLLVLVLVVGHRRDVYRKMAE
ncbi:MAG: type II toxin-antitoxin system RelE/ParE family toxin [bacterium]